MTQKKIGFWSLTALVVGNLVGAGVFMLPANLAPFKGISLLGWIAASCGAVMLAMIFAKLSGKLPLSGGPYVYVREAFGEKMGFATCWGYWMMAWISNLSLVIGIVGYMLPLLPAGYDAYSMHLQILVLSLLTAFNLLSVSVTAKGELLLTIFKIIPLLLLPLIGLFWINIDHFEITSPDSFKFWESFNTVTFLTLWGFVGLETGTVPGEQVDNPSKTIPRAVLTGTFIAMTVYILGTIATIGIIPCDVLMHSKAPYADIASHIFGGNWGVPISIITIISMIGALHGWIFVVGQIPLSAVKDGLFPKIFGKLNRFDAPHISILISSLCTLSLIFISHNENLGKQFQSIIEISLTLIFVIYFLCVLSFIKLTKKERPLSWIEMSLALLSTIFILWAMWAASVEMVLLSLCGFIIGIPVYIWVKRENKVCVSAN